MKDVNMKPYTQSVTTVLGVIGFTIMGVTACSSDGESADNPLVDVPEEVTEAPEINPPQAFAGSLVKSNAPTASVFLKNGLFYKLSQISDTEADFSPSPIVTDSESSLDGFSTTTTQESDVDEADRIEFDGRYFYVASYPNWYDVAPSANIRMLEKLESGALSEVNNINLSTEENLRGMYLNAPESDKLAVLSSTHQYYPVDVLMSDLTNSFFSGQSQFTLQIMGVETPAQAEVDTTITVEGNLISSRRIGQDIYIVSTFTPPEPEVETPETANTEEQNLEIYKAVLALSDDELLPSVTLNGDAQTLYSADDCYIPDSATENDGFSHLVQVLKVNLDDVTALEAVCTVTYVDYIYSSGASMYLAGNLDNATQLNKVSLGDTFDVVAAGSVPGTAGWSNPHLRFSESNGILRFVSSDYQSEPGFPFHRLYELEQDGNALSITAQLPGETAEQGLGKPQEDVYAVRYVGDKAYVVTFERIDPLYVIDLSISGSPQIVGELEIPGFSNYLHPVGDDYLIGVGQNVQVNTLPATDDIVFDILPVVTEMKVSLFDVRDPTSPVELSTLIFPNAYTPVEYDYRALSALVNSDYARFAMPIESWDYEAEDYHHYYSNKLIVMDLDRTLSYPELVISDELEVIPDEETPYVYAWEDRSVLVGDDVYYLHGNQIWYRPASDTTQLYGPF